MFEANCIEILIEGVRLRLNHPNDIIVVKEVFSDRCYEFGIHGESCFIDIGANIGIATSYFLAKHDGIAYAFELIPNTAAFARENLELNRSFNGRFEINPYGIFNCNTSMEIDASDHHTAVNSLFDWNIEARNIPTIVELKDAAEEFVRILAKNRSRNIVVKLDAEGSEYEIIEALVKKQILSDIDVLLLEHHKRSDRQPQQLEAWLSEAGFTWVENRKVEHDIGYIYAIQTKHAGSDQPTKTESSGAFVNTGRR